MKSLVAAEPAEEGTRYRLLKTVRQYAAERLAETGDAESVRQRHALAFLDLAERERALASLDREHDNLRAAMEWSLSSGSVAGPRLVRALGNFWLGRGMLEEGRSWLEHALKQPSTDAELRAGLMRLLGAVLFEVGDLRGAIATLSAGLATATAAGAPAEQARIRVQITEISKRHNVSGEGGAGALDDCMAAVSVLDAAADEQGLAEAWLLAGKLYFDRNEWPAALEAVERAIKFGQRSGNYRAWFVASHYLADIFLMSPFPLDAAIERAERLLREVSGEPYAEEGVLMALATLYAYVGRIADARAAVADSKAILERFASKLGLAFTAFPAGQIEVIAGDPAAAERCYKEGYEAFCAMGERGYSGQLAGLLAEALYAQGRLEEARQVIDLAEATAEPSHNETWLLWRSVKAKVLARQGQPAAASQLIAEAEAEISSAPWVIRALIPVAKAEVSGLAGDLTQAKASLNTALQIYEDRHAHALAEGVKFLLTKLSG